MHVTVSAGICRLSDDVMDKDDPIKLTSPFESKKNGQKSNMRLVVKFS